MPIIELLEKINGPVRMIRGRVYTLVGLVSIALGVEIYGIQKYERLLLMILGAMNSCF